MKNILVLSNNSISNTESNGRIHSYFVKDFIPNHLHNFFIRGIPDVEGVKYISISPKKALLSKLSFGLLNMSFDEEPNNANVSASSNPKSKKVFYHLIRSFAYLNNRRIIKNLSFYIRENDIDTIYLWGCNVPFLYNYAWKLSKKNNVKLITFTGEDYPLKDYNYISNHKSFLFYLFQKRFKKENKKAYLQSSLNYFANKELQALYTTSLNVSGEVLYFKSIFEKVNRVPNEINSLLYAGNLYCDRVNSLLQIAEYLCKYPNIVINIFGKSDDKTLCEIKKFKNIIYHGVVPYGALCEEIKKADLLLHIEGFSEQYVNDCKYAFSTKISDYFMTSLPMFVYGPIEISGIKFCKEVIPDFTCVSPDDLSKLDSIINGEIQYNVNYSFISSLFGVN